MDGYWSSATINKGWYMIADLELLKEQIKGYLYDNTNPELIEIQ